MPHSTTSEPGTVGTPDQIVNDGKLADSQISFLRQSTADLPLKDLQARFEEDGYLFVKGLLPRDAVLKAREEYFRYLAPTGVLKPGTKPIDGIFDDEQDRSLFPGIGAGAAGGNGHPGDHAAEFVDRALLAHYQDWYAEDLCKHPALKAFVAKFTGWGDDTTAFVRTLLRNNIPGNKAIGVHYDQIFLRHGEPTSITAWVPIGDIKLDGGGLIYLEKGHLLGIEQERKFTDEAKASGLTEEEAKNAFNQNMMSTGLLSEGPKEFAERFDRRWLIAEYGAGDVVLHNPFAIHASTLNQSKDNIIRLATDLRFVDSSRPWDTVSVSGHEYGSLLMICDSDGRSRTHSMMAFEARLVKYTFSYSINCQDTNLSPCLPFLSTHPFRTAPTSCFARTEVGIRAGRRLDPPTDFYGRRKEET